MMQLKNLFTFLAAVSAVRASALPVSTEVEEFGEEMTLEERNNDCTHGVHIVAAGGLGSTKGDIGLLQSLVDSVREAIPGSNVHECPYDGGDAGTQIGQGIAEMRAHVHHYAKKCPKTKMVLLGYSAGGAVVMDTLCGDFDTGDDQLKTHFRHNIVAEIVYGDPTWIAGKSYDQGTCTGAQGPSEDPRAYPGHCFPFGKKLRSYCDYNDPVCCNGDDTQVHFDYPTNYDADATQFVKARWEYSRNH